MARLAILSLFMGQTRNRFLQYQQPRSIIEILDMAGRTEGCEGMELRYPGDLADEPAVKAALDRNRLGVAAVNFASVRPDRWLRGAWSSTSTAERHEHRRAPGGGRRLPPLHRRGDRDRRHARDQLPAQRRHRLPLRTRLRPCLRHRRRVAQIADHNPCFQVCIEYKISEPRMRSLLGTAGETAAFCQMAFCQMVGRDNLGVTLDVGHALFANENAAQSAALLAKARRLFYVHMNDNDGRADWDLLPGAVHTWETVEVLHTLRALGYDDWFTFDIVPKELEPVEFFATAAKLTRQLEALARRIEPARLAELRQQKNAAQTLAYLHTLI